MELGSLAVVRVAEARFVRKNVRFVKECESLKIWKNRYRNAAFNDGSWREPSLYLYRKLLMTVLARTIVKSLKKFEKNYRIATASFLTMVVTKPSLKGVVIEEYCTSATI